MRRKWWDRYKTVPKKRSDAKACLACNGNGRVLWCGFLGGPHPEECRSCSGSGVENLEEVE